MKLYVDGQPWKWEVLLDDLNNPRPLRREPLRIGGGGGADNRFQGRIDDVRVYERELTRRKSGVLASAATVNEIAARGAAGAQPGRRRQDSRLLPRARRAGAHCRRSGSGCSPPAPRATSTTTSLPTVMVMEEMPTPRETHLLVRGSYDRPGEVVTPVLPDVPRAVARRPTRPTAWGSRNGWSTRRTR